MWLASVAEEASGNSFNLWYFLGSTVAALIGLAGLYITARSTRASRPAKRKEVKQVAQEGAQAYKEIADEIFTRLRAENQRLSSRVRAVETESDGYRIKWEECVKGRIGGGVTHRDNPNPPGTSPKSIEQKD